MAGYSGRPLGKKLGIKAGHRLGLVAAPDGFLKLLRQGELAGDVEVARVADPDGLLRSRSYDVLVAFVTERAVMVRQFAALASRLDPAGGLCIAWPKKASGRVTDVTEDVLRQVALE